MGKQQLVEIAKALSGQARILVMDEPTAALISREVSLLFETTQSLRDAGVGIVYISHRLDEVEAIAQRIVVLRDGNTVGDVAMADVSRAEIVRLMAGRDVESMYPTRAGEVGQAVLEVSRLARTGHFEDVTFQVCAGESDRILVFGRGGIVAEFERTQASQAAQLSAAAGDERA